ncbi:hypothetical protein [Bacillus sp. 2205SS5-2]|uniref:hypothetical protein n=1 Tax=Bacillus sp. 2205SS5-2 TaxID=3109031 RepID=UPI003006F8DA
MLREKILELRHPNVDSNRLSHNTVQPIKRSSLKGRSIQKIQSLKKDWEESVMLELLLSFSLVKKIHGVYLWDVNQRLRDLAKTNPNVQDFQRGIITIPLERRKKVEFITPIQKSEIEKQIDQLDGLELLRLIFLLPCKPVYKEEKFFDDVSRWIEIQIRSDENGQDAE